MLPKIKLASAPPEPVSFGAPGTPLGRDPWTHTPVPRASGQRPEPPRPCRGRFSFLLRGLNAFTMESRVQGALVGRGPRKASCPAGPPPLAPRRPAHPP